MLLVGGSSRGQACVLSRCSLYPWASGSACRVDIEGGAVLGSLFLLLYRRATRKTTEGSPLRQLKYAYAPGGLRGAQGLRLCSLIAMEAEASTKLKRLMN